MNRFFTWVLLLISVMSCGGGKSNYNRNETDVDAPIVISSLSSGVYSESQLLKLTCDDNGGSGCHKIVFSRGDTVLSLASEIYQKQIEITKSTRINFAAVDHAGNQSFTQNIQLEILFSSEGDEGLSSENSDSWSIPDTIIIRPEIPPLVKVSLRGGVYSSPISILLSCTSVIGANCETYYTLDGSRPTKRSSNIFGPINVGHSQLLRYFSIDQFGNESELEFQYYTIDRQVPELTSNIESGQFNQPVNLRLTCNDSGGSGCVKIYYTLNSMRPNEKSLQYNQPIILTHDVKLRAIAVDNAGNKSDVLQSEFFFDFDAPFVVSSFPKNGATQFSVKNRLLVSMSEPVDAISVNPNNIKLVDDLGVEVAIGLSVINMENILIVEPLESLEKGSQFSLILTGVRDRVSNSILSKSIYFGTTRQYIELVKSIEEDWLPKKIIQTEYDLNGVPLLQKTVAHPGMDNKWFTEDDKIVAISKRTFDVNGRVNHLINTNSFGLDGVWGTEDDVVSEYRQYYYDELTRDVLSSKTFSTAGADRLWFNSDDEAIGARQYQFDSNSVLQKIIHYSAAGMDAIWNTADDIIQNYKTFGYNVAESSWRITSYVEFGPDGLWMTGDDIVGEYVQLDIDGLNNTIFTSKVISAGADNHWLTADDVIGQTSTIDLPSVESFNPLFFNPFF